jgi:hypothetical protein
MCTGVDNGSVRTNSNPKCRFDPNCGSVQSDSHEFLRISSQTKTIASEQRMEEKKTYTHSTKSKKPVSTIINLIFIDINQQKTKYSRSQLQE